MILRAEEGGDARAPQRGQEADILASGCRLTRRYGRPEPSAAAIGATAGLSAVELDRSIELF